LADVQLRIRETELDWREVDGQVLALDLTDSRYLAINDSGRTLWLALIDGATSSELADALVKAHGLDQDRAEADVKQFVSDLDGRGLLVRDENS